MEAKKPNPPAKLKYLAGSLAANRYTQAMLDQFPELRLKAGDALSDGERGVWKSCMAWLQSIEEGLQEKIDQHPQGYLINHKEPHEEPAATEDGSKDTAAAD